MDNNEQSLKIGDRVRYVPRETDALEYGTVAEAVWQRRSQRDSLVVGVPDDDEYPTQYRLVAIFEPGEEASWSDRYFWFAPAERLQAVSEPEYEYMLRGASPASSPIQFNGPEQEREWLSVIDERVRAMFMRRRKPGTWERF